MKTISETQNLNRLKKDYRLTYDLLNHYVYELGYNETLKVFNIKPERFKEIYWQEGKSLIPSELMGLNVRT